MKSDPQEQLQTQQRECLQALYSRDALTPGMAIYRRSFLGNHGAALADTYPLLAARLPGQPFRMLAQQLLCEQPTRSGDLNDYGAGFASLLARQSDPAAPAWAALAQFEWQCFELLRAADTDDALTLDDAARLPQIRVALVAAARVCTLTYDLQLLLSDAVFPPPEIRCPVLLYRLTDPVAFFRAHIAHQALSDAEAMFLHALAAHERVLPALADTLQTHADFNPAPCLQQLLQHHLLQEIRT